MTTIARQNRSAIFGTCVLLAAATCLVFGQTLGYEFTNYDDPIYVTATPEVSRGLTMPGIAWAFTHSHAWNWHPLTTISHMLDCQLYGLNPAGHHGTNLILHTLGVVLLFLVLREMTGALWRSAFVAALFAIHPLRAESVAWIAERKDVLSGVFFMLTLAVYLRYTRKLSMPSYLVVVVVFALGLLSKPMLVTVPFVLLLLDYWPLKRFASEGNASGGFKPLRWLSRQSVPLRLALEKVPLVLLSAGLCVVTFIVQQPGAYMAQIRLPSRIINAVLSCTFYVYRLFWPVKLAAFYPYRVGALSIWVLAAALLLLGVTTAGVLKFRKQYPYALTGWFWYLIMLVPVIGIIRVGSQAQADRYTYLPHIGLYLALTWVVGDFSARWRYRRIILTAGAVGVLLALGYGAHVQASYWKNSETLWTRTLAVTSKNALAHNNLGTAFSDRGRILEAISHYRMALELQPRYALTHRNLAKALFHQGKLDEAITHWRESVAIFPYDAEAQGGLAEGLLQKGLIAEAMSHFEESLKLAPELAPMLNDFAWVLATCPDAHLRNGARAVELAQRADQVAQGRNPLFARTLAAAYAESGRFNDAIATAQRALPLAEAKGDSALAAALRLDIDLYRINFPLR
jgi:Tfp pilus assembly protein PilF